MKAALTLILALIAPPALATTPVQQSGTITPRHVPAWTTNGVIQDGGSATNGFLSELGITKSGGCALGINSGPVTGPYTQFCMGAASGQGYFNLQSFGGAPAATMYITINGVQYPFPGPGNGDVLGPPSSIDGDTAVFNGAGGTLLKDGGPASYAVPTNAALAAIPLTGRVAGFTVQRQGYYTYGDSPTATYTLQTSACSLNAGAGDGGLQVNSTDTAGNCWILGQQTAYDVRLWGATGSSTTETATGSGTTLTLGAIGDFAKGQNIRVPKGGASFTINQPSGLTVTSTQKASFTGTIAGTTLTASSVTGNIVPGSILAGSGVTGGTTVSALLAGAGGQAGPYTVSPSQTAGPTTMTTVPGSTTYCYRIASFTKNEGIGVAIAQQCATDGAAMLGLPHDFSSLTIPAPSPALGENLNWSAPSGAAPDGYVIYGRSSGSWVAIATVDATKTSFTDYGHNQALPSWIPSAPLSSAQPGRALVAISNVVGPVLTVGTLTTAVSGVTITHDDTVPLANALDGVNQPLIPAGQFNTTSGLTVASNSQTLLGVNEQSALIHGFGCYDILTVTGADDNLFTHGYDASDMGCGNVIAAVGASRGYAFRMQIANSYNGLGIGIINRFRFANVSFSVDHRGQYAVHVYSAGGFSQLATFDDLQTANSWTATAIHVDGQTSSTFIRSASSIQSMPFELVVDNAIQAPAAPHFVQMWDSALNNCNDACVKISGGQDSMGNPTTAAQFYFYRTYMQGNPGNYAPVVNTTSGTSNVNFIGGEIFGGDRGGLELHSEINNITALNVYGNSVTIGAYPDILVASNSIGTTITGGDNYVPGTGSTGTASQSYIYVQSGAQNVQITPGTSTGRLGCGIVNQTDPSNHVVIGGSTNGSPADTIDTAAGGDNLTVASYPNLYRGVDGLTAKLCRSGTLIAHNDQLDTAANILASSGLTGFTAGTSFNILYSSAVNAIMTLTGNTGITVTAGTAGIPASGGSGQISSVQFHCIVQSDAASIVCTGKQI